MENSAHLPAPAPTRRDVAIYLSLLTVGLAALTGLVGEAWVVGVGAVLVASVVLLRPEVGVCLLAVNLPVENATVVWEGVTLSRVLGVLVFGCWLLRKLARGEPWAGLLANKVVWWHVALVLLVLNSVLWAAYDVELVRYAQVVQLLALLLMMADLSRQPWTLVWISRSLVVGGVACAVLVLHQAYVNAGVPNFRAGEDIAGGVNGTATVLATLLPFAFGLLRGAQPLAWKAVGVTYVVLALPAVSFTFSRAAYIICAVAVGLQLLLMALRSRHRGVLALPLLFVVAIVIWRYVPVEAVLNRITSIGPYLASLNTPSEMGARIVHWKAGFFMFLDHPVLGVGYHNFGHYFRDYQFLVRGDVMILGDDEIWGMTTLRSPHSSLFGIMAELGMVGLVVWGALQWRVFLLFGYVGRRLRAIGVRSVRRIWHEQIAIAFFLLAVNGLINVVHTEKVFWTVAGLAVGLHLGLRSWRPPAPPAPRQRPPTPHETVSWSHT